MFSKRQDYFKNLKDKIGTYTDTSQASEWLSRNFEKVKNLFEDYTLRDFILEPFKGVFKAPSTSLDQEIYVVITQVAIINAVLAGLPGKMGVGVYVVMALEGWMAYKIAKIVGINIRNTNDIWKYFGLLAASLGVIFYLFRTLLGLGFSVASIIPGINPLILAELFVTDLVGILFLVGFKEAKSNGSFSIPSRMTKEIYETTKSLFNHQYNILKATLSPENLKFVGTRLVEYLKGDFPVDIRLINGEGFATLAMAYLLSGQYEKLEGPIGNAFLDAIRLRWSAQLGPDASQDEIAQLFSKYDSEQLVGVTNTIKGKMFEIMVTDAENNDGDEWMATMHTDERFPGSDITFSNIETGEELEVSLKALSSEGTKIIESALVRYPDIPIMTTKEMSDLYESDPRVFGGDMTNARLESMTEENIDKLLESIQPKSTNEIIIGGVTVGALTALWPFTMAYLRKKISKESLTKAFEHIIGVSGVALASRVCWGTLFGPIFAWYLLARGVQGITELIEPSKRYKIEYFLNDRNT